MSPSRQPCACQPPGSQLPAGAGTSSFGGDLRTDLGRHHGAGAALYAAQLGWREFDADVLARSPHSAREYLKAALARMDYDQPGSAFRAWRDGSRAI